MADRNDSSLTVSAYSQKFFQSYSDSIEPSRENADNKQLAGQTLINLVKKLHEAGSKDDMKVPLRVLRDEIGRIYFGSVQQRDLRIEKLFQLYDALEEGAQEEIRTKSGKESAWANQALEELRQRFSRLVIGDTWETYPELKLKALQHMHLYAVKEKLEKQNASTSLARQGPTVTTSRLGMKKLSRSFSGPPQSSTTWQTTFDDLAKAPGSRLLPILKLLLSSGKLAPEAQPATAAQGGSEVAKDEAPAGTIPEGGPVPVPGTPESQKKEGLRTQASGISDGGLGRPMSELDINMDDLLGLNDAFEAPKSQDPFKAAPEGAQPTNSNAAAPTQQGQQQQQQLRPPPEPSRQVVGNNSNGNSQAVPQTNQPFPNPVPPYNTMPPQMQQGQQNGGPQQFAPSQFAPHQFGNQQYTGQQLQHAAHSYPFNQHPGQHFPGQQGMGGDGHRDMAFTRQTSGPYTGYVPGGQYNPGMDNPIGNRHSADYNRQSADFNRQTSGPFAVHNGGGVNFNRQAPHGGYNSGPPQMTSAGSGAYGSAPTHMGGAITGNNTGPFNPFELPSPTYASPVPKHLDNTFAEFSPVANAPVQPKVPNPMRNVPESGNKNVSSPTYGGPQPPRSSFSSW